MKAIKTGIFSLLMIFFMTACDPDTGVGYISVKITATSQTEGVSTDGLTVTLENFDEGVKIVKTLQGETTIDSIIPGLYNINISGQVEDEYGKAYNMNGSLTNRSLITNGEAISIEVSGSAFSPLIFKEIFYTGTAPFYFRNQYYEIYNNSQLTIYLDGVYFANLTPTKSTATQPVWPAEDGENYAYAERIWQIPGSGTEYPLEPGESIVISQFAANHQDEKYNPDSPVDCSKSEFEFNMDNPNYPDQPATDMIHVYYNGSSAKGSMPQYLTSVFGGAYVIFRVPEGDTYDPANDTSLQTTNQATTSTQLYGKIPVTYIYDAVEAVDNEAAIQNKRVPSYLDAGATYVGATYNSLSVTRKQTGTNENGTPIIQDTNNSTEDFIHGITPEFRRYGAKAPAWSPAYTN